MKDDNANGTEDITAQIGEATERYWKQGYCCSEAVLLAAAETFAPDRMPVAQSLGGGLCGGMGNKQATCGVFTGGAVAIGLVADYQGPAKQQAPEVKALAAEYHSLLQQEAGGQVCEDLLQRMGVANVNHRLCRKLTRRGAELLASLLMREGKLTAGDG